MTAEEWSPQLGPHLGREYKWALSRDGQFAVWEVAGPGDGYPSHRDYLEQAWGRHPEPAKGDIVGSATVDETTVHLLAYASSVPEPATNWARVHFPTHQLTHTARR